VTKVRIDQDVRMTLYAFEGQVLRGKVTRIYDQADEARRTFEVDVHLTEANDRLAPGMTGELAFIMDAKAKAVAIPAQAVQRGDVFGVRDGRIVNYNAKVGAAQRRARRDHHWRRTRRPRHHQSHRRSCGRQRRSHALRYPAQGCGLNKPAATDGSFKGFH
jgi:multidrug efflux pump subunit AcrA (membrane-fusion protein)